MKISVNGTVRQFEDGLTVYDLLQELGIQKSFVAVALNRTCIPKTAREHTEVHEGDEVEILAPQQGG